MYINDALANFAAGELSPSVRGRYDIKLYRSGCEKMINFIAEVQGAAKFRPGTTFVHHTRLNQTAVLLPFQFTDEQAYLLEFTNLKMRIYKDNGIIINSDKTITGITQADPCVVTSGTHGYTTGDEIFTSSVVGMTELNGRSFVITVIDADTYSLNDIDGNAIDSTEYTAYALGGVSNSVVEVTTPYTEAQLDGIRIAQNADVMYIVHGLHAPRKLTRASHTSWTIGTFVRTADPFTGAGDYPTVAAFYEGRLIYASTIDAPETIWMSRSPDINGNPRYDNFTTGADADHALVFTLAPAPSGKVDTIEWMSPTNKFLGLGTFGGVSRLTGSGTDEAISPTSIMNKHVDTYGCQDTPPIASGSITIYVQRGGLILRSFEYNAVVDEYESVDRNLVADHIPVGGFKTIVFQNGRPDILWAVKNDGTLAGLTFKAKEDVSGWHRHKLAGVSSEGRYGKVISLGVIPQETNYDQVWLVVERIIDGSTRRYVEFFNDSVEYVEPEDFFEVGDDEAEDLELYNNALYEQQKLYKNLDSSLSFDGSVRGEVASATITPAAVTGTGIAFTASADVFTASDVGNEIWKKYIAGVGGGRAVITAYVSATVVTCTITKDFDTVTAIPAGEWFLTASTISGLEHLEGQTVRILTDGGVHPDKVVVNGSVSLNYEASAVHIGLGYTGFIKTMNLELVQNNTSVTQTAMKNVDRFGIRFLNTLGAQYGTSLYSLETVNFRSAAHLTNRPPPLFSGVRMLKCTDSWSREKYVYVRQSQPLPSTIQLVEIYAEVVNDNS